MEMPQVSIVMPLFNSALYLEEAISSVITQSFSEWELIIVDDCSDDDSIAIVNQFAIHDNRIRLFRHSHNMGVAFARNTGLEYVKGRYIAFLDSDDVWMPNKLERQLFFMNKSHSAMCFTAYETIESDGKHRNFVYVPQKITYQGFLKNTVTCSHTVVFDTDIVELRKLRSPIFETFDYPEDMAVWLQVLKTGIMADGLNEVLAKNRKRLNSRSSSKLRAVQRTWNQYRCIEKMSLSFSLYCLFWQLFHAVKKRV